MLKAALYLAGDRRYEKDLKAVDASPIADDRVNSWSFYSDRRRRGLMLSTFHDLFGNDPAGEPLATRVAEGARRPALELLQHAGARLGHHRPRQVGHRHAAPRARRRHAHRRRRARSTPRKTKQKTNDKTWSLLRASEYKSLTLDVPQQARRHVARDLERGRARRAATTRSAATACRSARTYQHARRHRDRSRRRQGASSATSCSSRSRSRTRAARRSRTSRSSIGCPPASRSRTRASAAASRPTGSRTTISGRSTS